MKDQSTIYADITKVEKRPNEPNFRYVHARISDETKDLDGQTADYGWLKEALPDWFKWGNVRDMHETNVVGKAKELTDLGPQIRGFDGVLKVVDPVAVMKLDEELFTGVSIGIKGPRVLNNKGAIVHPSQPGTIKGGKIVEVSLVDHPCNENCKITVAKDAASGLEMITKGATLEKIAQVDILKEGALYWYKRAKWNAAARREATDNGHAEAGGRFPIDDASDVSDAVHLINTGHGNDTDRAHVIARAKALGQGNPFKKKNQDKIATPAVTPEDLETYKSRFHGAFANAGVALSDGSYLIMDEGDLILAKALHATGFGNIVAADLLIKRREAELTSKAAPATQQATPTQSEHATAPGARENRDNPDKNAPPAAKPKGSKNPDKETPAHQSVDASGSSAAFDDSSEVDHPPTKPAKKDKTKKPKSLAGSGADQAGEPPTHTHGDDTGSTGTRTNTAKASKTDKIANGLALLTKRKKDGTIKPIDPTKMSDKKLAKAYNLLVKAGYAPPAGTSPSAGGVSNSGPDSFNPNAREVLDFQRGGAGSPGGNRALIEQLVRNMQGRMIDYSQGPQAPDIGRGGSGGVDAPEEVGETDGKELINQSGLMRDGDPRINANTPEQALAQGGPLRDGGVTSSGDAGVPNTSLPFATAPQAGSTPVRMAPGSLPGTLGAPGDADPRQSPSGPAGSGGMSPASPPLRSVGPAAQAGPDPNAGGRRWTASTISGFVNPQGGIAPPGRKAAKADKKGKKKKRTKNAKMIDKLAKSAVADRVGTAVPDSVKAAVASALKKFTKNLEKSVLVKYATADQLKSLQSDIDKLGEMARPGGPFVGQITAVDKVINANEFAQPQVQVVEPDTLEQIERYERLSRSDNRQLAVSAQAELKKLLDSHFPKEVVDELQKRKRSAAK